MWREGKADSMGLAFKKYNGSCAVVMLVFFFRISST